MPYDQPIFSGEQAFPTGLPRIDISGMRRSENVEDLRPRSRAEYLYNVLMSGPGEHFSNLMSQPFADPREARAREFQQYLAQDRPAATSDLALQAGVADAARMYPSMASVLTGMATPADPYTTQLTPLEQMSYRAWKQQYASRDSGADYDLQGAFRAGLMPDPQTGHWPDTFKKPNHPTFSDQSMYAVQRPDLAGSWVGEDYTPSAAPVLRLFK